MLYEPFLFQLYNILFTSLPIVVYALLDREYSGRFLEATPSKYKPGLKDSYFNAKIFWMNVILATAQAFILPLESFYTFETISVDNHGHILGFWNYGMMCYGTLVIIANIKVLLFSYTVNVFSLFGIIGGIAAFIMSFLTLNYYHFGVIYEEFQK